MTMTFVSTALSILESAAPNPFAAFRLIILISIHTTHTHTAANRLSLRIYLYSTFFVVSATFFVNMLTSGPYSVGLVFIEYVACLAIPMTSWQWTDEPSLMLRCCGTEKKKTCPQRFTANKKLFPFLSHKHSQYFDVHRMYSCSVHLLWQSVIE